MSYFIFIAGASGSGKTTFADRLRQTIEHTQPNVSIIHLSMDDYYNAMPEDIQTEEQIAAYIRKTNFDEPESIDFALFHQHLRDLARGQAIEVPSYDFSCSDRRAETKTVLPADVVIVEGIFALHNLKQVGFDKSNYLSVFIQADSYLAYQQRRMVRDPVMRNSSQKEVRQKELRDIRSAFFQYIRPSAQQYAELFITNNHMINNESDLADTDNAFASDIKSTIALIKQRNPLLNWQVHAEPEPEPEPEVALPLDNQWSSVGWLLAGEALMLASLLTLPLTAPMQVALSFAMVVAMVAYVAVDRNDRDVEVAADMQACC